LSQGRQCGLIADWVIFKILNVRGPNAKARQGTRIQAEQGVRHVVAGHLEQKSAIFLARSVIRWLPSPWEILISRGFDDGWHDAPRRQNRRGRSNDRNVYQIIIVKVNFISRGEKKVLRSQNKRRSSQRSGHRLCFSQNRHQNIGIVWPCSEICSEQGANQKDCDFPQIGPSIWGV
jgi:hypothetical protein